MDYEVDLVLQLLYFEALQKAVLKKRIRWRSRVKKTNKQRNLLRTKCLHFFSFHAFYFFFTFFVRSKHSGAWC